MRSLTHESGAALLALESLDRQLAQAQRVPCLAEWVLVREVACLVGLA